MTRRDCTCPRARHVHGTEQAYISDRCHCDDCRHAHAQRAAWRRRMIAYGHDVSGLARSTGAIRRLEALAWLGWSFRALADQLGWDPVVLQRVRLQPRLATAKAAAICGLYERLWDRDPPMTSKGERISANRTRALARRRGYLPSLAWDDIDDPAERPKHRLGSRAYPAGVDHAKVHRAIAGERVRLNNAERRQAVLTLVGRGLSDGQIARLLHSTPAAVGMIRRRNRKDTAA